MLMVSTGAIRKLSQQLGIWIMIIATRIIYRMLYEFSTGTGGVAKNSGLCCSTSIALAFCLVQVVKY